MGFFSLDCFENNIHLNVVSKGQRRTATLKSDKYTHLPEGPRFDNRIVSSDATFATYKDHATLIIENTSKIAHTFQFLKNI